MVIMAVLKNILSTCIIYIINKTMMYNNKAYHHKKVTEILSVIA